MKFSFIAKLKKLLFKKEEKIRVKYLSEYLSFVNNNNQLVINSTRKI